MANIVKRENIVIITGVYEDNQGNQKKVYRTIGELVTFDDGGQAGKLWGPTGEQKFNVYEKKSNNPQQQMANTRQQAGFQQPQGGFQQPQGNQAPPQQPSSGGFDDDIPWGN